ncbi:MAG: hypothetical protein ACFCBW_01350 [Candidatus Competibacterales bacterium]
MESFSYFLAGLGLFFVGVKAIGESMKAIAGRRLRRFIATGTKNAASSALLGTGSGLLIQNPQAVTLIAINLMTAGALTLHQAMNIAVWADVGAAFLVMVATLDILPGILLLLGLVGCSFYFDLHRSIRWGTAVSTLWGIALLLFGVHMIKVSGEPVGQAQWFRDAIVMTNDLPVVAFFAGILLAMIAPAPSVAVVSIALASAGALPAEQVVMILLGVNIGAAIALMFLGINLRGTGRQVLWLMLGSRLLSVVPFVGLFAIERATGMALLSGPLALISDELGQQMVGLFLLVQVAGALAWHWCYPQLIPLTRYLSPATREEALSKPVFINDRALEEPQTALTLVDKEQQRLLGFLPHYLSQVRLEEGEDLPPGELDTLSRCTREGAGQVDHFTLDLLQHGADYGSTLSIALVRGRVALIQSLQDSLFELARCAQQCRTTGGEQEAALVTSIVEATHFLLETTVDSHRDPQPDSLAILLQLTSDRSQVMRQARRQALALDNVDDPQLREALFNITHIFERIVWLLNRVGLNLSEAVDDHQADPQGGMAVDYGAEESTGLR